MDHLTTWWRCSGSSWRSGLWQWQMSIACRHASSRRRHPPAGAARSHILIRPVFLWASQQRLSATAGLLKSRCRWLQHDRHLEFVFIPNLLHALRRWNGLRDRISTMHAARSTVHFENFLSFLDQKCTCYLAYFIAFIAKVVFINFLAQIIICNDNYYFWIYMI